MARFAVLKLFCSKCTQYPYNEGDEDASLELLESVLELRLEMDDPEDSISASERASPSQRPSEDVAIEDGNGISSGPHPGLQQRKPVPKAGLGDTEWQTFIDDKQY
jgi:hypothetical protein